MFGKLTWAAVPLQVPIIAITLAATARSEAGFCPVSLPSSQPMACT